MSNNVMTKAITARALHQSAGFTCGLLCTLATTSLAVPIVLFEPAPALGQYAPYLPYVPYAPDNPYLRCMNEDTSADRIIRACSAAVRSGRYGSGVLAKIYLNRGKAYAEKNECDKALADLNKAIRLNPGLQEAHQQRNLLLRQGDATIASRSGSNINTSRSNAPPRWTAPPSQPSVPQPAATTPPSTNQGRVVTNSTASASPPNAQVRSEPSASQLSVTPPAAAAPPTSNPARAVTNPTGTGSAPNAQVRSDPPASQPSVTPPAATTPPTSNQARALTNPSVSTSPPTQPSVNTIDSAPKTSIAPKQPLRAKLAACSPAAASAPQGRAMPPTYSRLECTVNVLVSEATSIEIDYGDIVSSNYTNPRDIKAICDIAPEKIRNDLAKAEAFDARVEALQGEFEASVTATEDLKNLVRDINVGAMDDPQRVMRDMLAAAMAPIEKASAEHLKVRKLVQKIQASQKAMNTVRQIRGIFCTSVGERS
jgi:hypothetical protein